MYVRASVLGLLISSALILLAVATSLVFNSGQKSANTLLLFSIALSLVSLLVHVEETQYGFTMSGFVKNMKNIHKDDDKEKEQFVVRRVS